MPATSDGDSEFNSVASVREFLDRWIRLSRTAAVSRRENVRPANEPAADYEIAYEVAFEPVGIDQVRAELWVTPGGLVAVGLERWARIAQRLGARSTAHRFVAGHEPAPMTPVKLETVLSLAAKGDVVVKATVVPMLGLLGAEMVGLAPNEDSARRLRDVLPWLRTAPRSKYASSRSVLRYSAWPRG